MILKRKLYATTSSTVTNKKPEREQKESKTGYKNRMKMTGLSAGAITALGTAYSEMKNQKLQSLENRKVIVDDLISNLNNTSNLDLKSRAINQRYDDLIKTIKRKYANDPVKRDTELAKVYDEALGGNTKLLHKVVDSYNKHMDNVPKKLNEINKKYLKKRVKGGLVSAAIGTATGLGLNELAKYRLKKRNIKLYDKDKKKK